MTRIGALILGFSLAVSTASFGATLSTTLGAPNTATGIGADIGTRQVPYDATPPICDGTITTGEYTYVSPLIQWNGGTSTHQNGSLGYGDSTSATAHPDNAADLSFTIYMSHDANNFYMAVDVVDDVLCNDSTTAANTWNNDTIELYFDFDDSRAGRYAGTAADLGGVAGGRVDFPSSTEGNQTVADIRLSGANQAANYGPSFTLADSSYGRFKGTSFGTSAVDSSPGAANANTDIEFFMHRINPTVNGNRVLEVRIPVGGLSYNRTTHPAGGAPVGCGVFTNDIIGVRTYVDDDDTHAGTAQYAMMDLNALGNLNGTDNVLNPKGAILGTFGGATPYIAAAWDAVTPGIINGQAWNYEGCSPRYKLLAQGSSVSDWHSR